MKHVAELERRVLGVMQLDAELASAVVAKQARCSVGSVHRIMKQVLGMPGNGAAWIVNPHALGLSDYCLFVRYAARDRRSRGLLIESCNRHPLVAYMAELSGEYQFTISIFAHSIFEVEEFLDELYRKVPEAQLGITVALRSEWTLLQRPAFAALSPRKHLTRARTEGVYQPSPFELELLQCLSSAPMDSVLGVSRCLGSPESTVRLAIQRLRKHGVITGKMLMISPRRYGRTSFRALLDCGGSHPGLNAEVSKFAAKRSGADGPITEIVRCLGGWDFEINFQVQEPAEAGDFVQELYAEFGGTLRQVTTLQELAIHVTPRFGSLRTRSSGQPLKR